MPKPRQLFRNPPQATDFIPNVRNLRKGTGFSPYISSLKLGGALAPEGNRGDLDV